MNLDMEQLQDPRVQVSQGVLNWLLEVDEPSIRYETLVHLLGSMENESVVEETGRLIGKRGWAAKILERQKGGTYWDNPYSCLVPKWSEFLLRHKIFKSDRDDSVILLEFTQTHYPIHYKYDFLHALRVLTSIGVTHDPRLDDAVKLLLEKRLPDGKWALDGVYRGWRTNR